jgi:hypothetical protein
MEGFEILAALSTETAVCLSSGLQRRVAWSVRYCQVSASVTNHFADLTVPTHIWSFSLQYLFISVIYPLFYLKENKIYECNPSFALQYR